MKNLPDGEAWWREEGGAAGGEAFIGGLFMSISISKSDMYDSDVIIIKVIH